jgi:peptidoglycan/xylan/chitin deacetylase (PgdA/CDA1 family)
MTRPRTLILTYHRIASGRDPLQQCVQPERFAAQLEVLKQLAEVIPLTASHDTGSQRRVAITFDDGYADNAFVAAPILRDAGLSATFFVPSRICHDSGEFWWDRLEHLLLDRPPSTPTLDIRPADRPLRVDVRTEAGQWRALKALNRRLRPLTAASIEDVIADVARQVGGDTHPRCDAHATMNQDALCTLAGDPLFEIGGHGVTHTMLSALPAEDQREELQTCRGQLEAVTGKRVASLAYPYGIESSITAETVLLSRACGYTRAYMNTPGLAGDRQDPFRLPRHMVYDWTTDELAAQVDEWFSGR